MLGERYATLFIANLILQTPPILETFHTIILMKKMNLASLFSPAVIFKITSVLRYVENSIYWAGKAIFIRGIEFFDRKKALCFCCQNLIINI